MTYQFSQTITNGENSNFRHMYVANWIQQNCGSGKLLDIGAGPMPYRNAVEKTKTRYFSQDFEQYVASAEDPGLQSSEWPVYGHDYICDIEDLKAEDFNFILCTEVLEHVPNPLVALEVISNALLPGGKGLITMPFASRMHQAPYWFSSGLSKFWFEKHLPNYSLRLDKVVIAGDFVDQMDSEIRQLLVPVRILNLPIGHLIARAIQLLRPLIRRQLPVELQESGGLGIYIEITKINGIDSLG